MLRQRKVIDDSGHNLTPSLYVLPIFHGWLDIPMNRLPLNVRNLATSTTAALESGYEKK